MVVTASPFVRTQPSVRGQRIKGVIRVLVLVEVVLLQKTSKSVYWVTAAFQTSSCTQDVGTFFSTDVWAPAADPSE